MNTLPVEIFRSLRISATFAIIASTSASMAANVGSQFLSPVAELTVALFLLLERRLYEANVKSREGSFKTKGPSDFLGNEINGKTFGQIGMGNIAQRIAYTLELLCNSSSHSLSRLGVGGKNIAEIEAHLQEKGLCLRAG